MNVVSVPQLRFIPTFMQIGLSWLIEELSSCCSAVH